MVQTPEAQRVARELLRDMQSGPEKSALLALLDHAHEQTMALRNVMALAMQMKRGKVRPDAADHLLRFCKQVGVEPSILRSTEGG